MLYIERHTQTTAGEIMEIRLADGITLEFEFNQGDSSPAEKMTHDYPGCAEELVFDSVIKIDDVEYTDDLETLRDALTDIIEGRDLQEMMEEEFTENNAPEPDEDDCRGMSRRRSRMPWNMQ